MEPNDLQVSGRQTEPEAERPVAERMVRRFLEHPFRFPLAAMLIGLGIGLPRHSMRDLPALLLVCAMFAVWLRLWVGRRAHDPTGRSPFAIAVAIVGSLIMGGLVSLELGLAIVPLSMMPQYFIACHSPWPCSAASPLRSARNIRTGWPCSPIRLPFPGRSPWCGASPCSPSASRSRS